MIKREEKEDKLKTFLAGLHQCTVTKYLSIDGRFLIQKKGIMWLLIDQWNRKKKLAGSVSCLDFDQIMLETQ